MVTESLAPLPASFFARQATEVAIALIGCHLVSEKGAVRTHGRIVETEAYFGVEDLASHAARLRTGRVLSMGGPVAVAYVYRSYGIHAMLNAVAHVPGGIGVVLIRAIQPLSGLETMRERRGDVPDQLLCGGPGRLCQALGITLDDHGTDLTQESPLSVLPWDGRERPSVLASGRIGISRATDVPWRYFEAGNPFVSAHKRGTPIEEERSILLG
jgi:DNA-3-methyladenine glycosylase